MRHFSLPVPVARHTLGVLLAPLATVLIALTSLLHGGTPCKVGTHPAAVDLAVVTVGTDEHLGTARKACAKIESTNRLGIHRLAPCQADQEWTGCPSRGMGYLMHIPCSGFAGGSAGKNLSGFGLAPPPSFLRGKAVLPYLLSRAFAPERMSPPSSSAKPDSLRQPRYFAASGARHAFDGIRSCRTKSVRQGLPPRLLPPNFAILPAKIASWRSICASVC